MSINSLILVICDLYKCLVWEWWVGWWFLIYFFDGDSLFVVDRSMFFCMFVGCLIGFFLVVNKNYYFYRLVKE